MAIAFTFPGQGSQFVGMGLELCQNFSEAKAVFDEVDDALNERLSAIMFEGPEEALMLTANAQPALMAVSLAVIRVLQAQDVEIARYASYVAGHSLGEYSALAAAGALSLSDAAQLLRIRGNAMQSAVAVGEGAMAALLGFDFAEAAAIASEAAENGQICQAANDNAPGQVVLSGHKIAIDRAITIAKERGARRAILLAVSAPFHCQLMAPAADVMRGALADIQMQKPVVPLLCNVLASPINDPDMIRKCLVEQVTGVVRWRETISWFVENDIDCVLEIGAGKVLTGLARRIDRSLQALSVGTPDDIAAFVERLQSDIAV